MALLLLLTFTIGLFFGSFFKVIIDRTIRGEQFLKGHSYCESCKHKLSTKDLIPIISYISLRGKCRYCHKKIPSMLAVVELTTGLVFASIIYWYLYISRFAMVGAFQHEGLLFLAFLFILASLLLLLFFADLKYKLIPDIFVIGLILLYLTYLVLYYVLELSFAGYGAFFFASFYFHLLAAFLLFAFFGILHVAFKGKAMGEGDIYLSAVLGLYLGLLPSLVMWFAAFLLGAVIGVSLMIVKGKSRKYAIAFGPFLILGFIIAMFFGNQIILGYLAMLYG